MIVSIQGILVDVIEKEYEFEGKNGVSYQLVIYSEGNLQKVKVSQETFNQYSNKINEFVDVECNIFVKGSYSLTYRA